MRLELLRRETSDTWLDTLAIPAEGSPEFVSWQEQSTEAETDSQLLAWAREHCDHEQNAEHEVTVPAFELDSQAIEGVTSYTSYVKQLKENTLGSFLLAIT